MRKAGTRSSRPGRSTTDGQRGREQILRAAAVEFGTRGFDGATTARIAHAAGVTQPLVHHHFGSKLGLWEAVLEQLFGELRALQEGTMRDLQGVDLTTWLRVLLRQFVLFSARRPELARIIALEGSSTKGLDRSIERHVRPQLDQLRGLLEQVVREREVTLSETEIQLMCYVVLGASTHAFRVVGSARRIFGLDLFDVQTQQTCADLVVRVLFGALDAVQREDAEARARAAKDSPSARPRPRARASEDERRRSR